MNEKGNAVADAPTLLHSERAEAEHTHVAILPRYRVVHHYRLFKSKIKLAVPVLTRSKVLKHHVSPCEARASAKHHFTL